MNQSIVVVKDLLENILREIQGNHTLRVDNLEEVRGLLQRVLDMVRTPYQELNKPEGPYLTSEPSESPRIQQSSIKERKSRPHPSRRPSRRSSHRTSCHSSRRPLTYEKNMTIWKHKMPSSHDTETHDTSYINKKRRVDQVSSNTSAITTPSQSGDQLRPLQGGDMSSLPYNSNGAHYNSNKNPSYPNDNPYNFTIPAGIHNEQSVNNLNPSVLQPLLYSNF